MNKIEKEFKECDDWFDSHAEDLYIASDKKEELPPFCYLWEDYEEAKQFIIDNKLQNTGRILTLVEEDGNMFVISGWHFVNRLGYFFSTKQIYDYENGLLLRLG